MFVPGEHNNILLNLSVMLHFSVFIDKNNIGLLFQITVRTALFKYHDKTRPIQ
jgi:hypothetical protein